MPARLHTPAYATEDPALGAALEAALIGGLRCEYQPIVDLESGRVVAYEALARGPVGPLARPDALFAAARRAGRLAELDQGCRAAAFRGAVAAELFDPLLLFVNVEPAVLTAGPLDALTTLADQAPGHLRVMLEITERALATSPAELLRALVRIRELGWRVALDDVGADPASLTFLSVLQPDVVKLDLALVQDQPSPAVAEVMHAANAYAERSGALLLAEGVEDHRHVAIARALGATLGQGWFFGRPSPAPEAVAGGPYPLPPPPVSPGTAAGRESPFAILAPGTVRRRSTKALLVEMSLHLERQAAKIGELGLLVSTFQESRHFTPQTARRYAELGTRLGFTGALGLGLPTEPVPGVRGATLDPDDPVCAEWDVVVLGPHFSAALLARDLGSVGGSDADREFEYVLTYQRDVVVQTAQRLLLRLTESPALP